MADLYEIFDTYSISFPYFSSSKFSAICVLCAITIVYENSFWAPPLQNHDMQQIESLYGASFGSVQEEKHLTVIK